MKIVGNVVGIICLLVGVLWVLQGANIVGGSFMSGQSRWSIIGVVVGLVGLGVLYWVNIPRGNGR